jgi:hypothetical protein
MVLLSGIHSLQGVEDVNVLSLAVIALVAIIAEVVLLWSGRTASEALLTIAATAVGALGGIALPGND